MANCAPCLKLGLQLVAHYPASKGKEPECYYHHFGMPLPKAIQEKIAQPKNAVPDDATLDTIQKAQNDRTERDQAKERGIDVDEERKAATPAPDKKTDLRAREKPMGTAARAGLTPDVCEECWRDGHSCPAHCTVGGQRLCIDCADGKPCAIARQKAANSRTPPHERYHVTIPGQKNTKPRAADVALVTDDKGSIVGVKRTPAPPPANPPALPPKRARNMSLVLDNKGLPTGAVSTPAKHSAEKDSAKPQQQEKERSEAMPEQKESVAPVAPANGTATIIVTEKHMDAFWSKLSLPEKAAIFQRQLEGA